MIKLADGRGHLYQWDTGRQVECDAEQVHFSNHHYGVSIDVEVKNGKATIPNQLLTSAIPLKAWAWVKDDNGEYTKEEQIFLVAKRNKPSDYVYTPTEIKTWQDLQNQIGDLNGLKTAHKDNLVNAINDAAESGGAGDFIIKMTVASDEDGYTVTSCDATVEQIDAAFNSDKNIVLTVAENGETNRYVLSLVQATPGFGYIFQSFFDVYLFYANIDKRDSTLFFGKLQMPANAITYSNAALPNISTVGGALDKLVPNSHTHENKDTLDKISDADGKLQYNGSDVGLKGDKGDPGAKGAPGKTPVKGIDYWTEEDKQEIIDDIHPAYYIDLAGTYPNYTCPVAMDDIKAAYTSGYNLVCRCTLGKYTATLPLFIPMPAANTWIFSGSGCLQSMGFVAQSFTVAITGDGVKAQNKELTTSDGKLPNPYELQITVGNTPYLYDGSERINIVIDDGTEVSY